MVKTAFRLCFTCALAVFGAGALHAKDLAAYQVGDVAATNITTPVALDVIDPQATAARKAAEALKTPAIFRNYPDAPITNAMAEALQAAFAATRSNFLAALKTDFPTVPLDRGTITSARFTGFLAAFNSRNKSFPVSAGLAGRWAAGNAGRDTENHYLALLLRMTHRPIRPDSLPEGIALGDTLLLAPVNSTAEKLSLADAEQRGELITAKNMTTLSRLQMLFRREFPEEEQALARSLSVFLQPNCVLDSNLTQQARSQAVRRLVVVDHYDAGQVIVQRGATIDLKTKAALEALNEKLMPGQLDRQIAAARAQVRQQQLQLRARNTWLMITLAAGLGVCFAAILFAWQQSRLRRPKEVLPVSARAEPPNVIQTELAPQLARAFKDALVHELAAQRHEMLSVQQSAAAEIADLVRRLDRLQAPLHERLRIYETQIQQLEKELAARTEENRELLKMKIELIRHQLESERARGRADFTN